MHKRDNNYNTDTQPDIWEEEDQRDNSKIDFHSKLPLSIDILNAESGDENEGEGNVILLSNKAKGRNDSEPHDFQQDNEDNTGKYNPWVDAKEKKLSPFGNFK